MAFRSLPLWLVKITTWTKYRRKNAIVLLGISLINCLFYNARNTLYSSECQRNSPFSSKLLRVYINSPQAIVQYIIESGA